MRFPQEIVVQAFLPTYRALLAQALAKQGLRQEQIAEHVGVTQAQVSKYLAGRVEVEPRIAEDPRVVSTVNETAAALAEGRLDAVGAMAKSLDLIRTLENRGPICELHAEAMPELEGTGCDACIDPSSRVLAEHQVLVDVRRALRRLLLIEGVGAWIPHVGSNLAQATEHAQGLWDVAALPGRIDVIGGVPRVTTEPRMGASRHVATVVLAIMEEHPDTRAALNLAYTDELLARADASGLEHVKFEASYDGRREAVAESIRQAHGAQPPPILYHEGAFGIEPIAYVLGQDAEHVIDRVQALTGPAEPG